MKKVFLSLNEESRRFSRGEPCKGSYKSSLNLARALKESGFETLIVHPNQVYLLGNQARARALYTLDDSLQIVRRTGDTNIQGDLFFVYGLGEDVNDIEFGRRYICDVLPIVQGQVGLMLNSAESTAFEFKPNQKSLDFPWIPGFDIRNKKDLEDLVGQEKVIAKPKFGYMGKGVYFLESQEDTRNFPDDLIPHYLFERFIESREERRYAYLDGELVLARRMTREGQPGKEKPSDVRIIEGNPRELEISKQAIEETGMFFGAVDFREDFMLEINGSGTGLISPGETDIYDLTNKVVSTVKKRLS